MTDTAMVERKRGHDFVTMKGTIEYTFDKHDFVTMKGIIEHTP